jgi:epoxyqueuosine reductase
LVDARRCISYLTIEHPGPIPVALRPAMGNRIYGCDDCQLICPWNKFAQPAVLADFDARSNLVGRSLVDLLAWREADFLQHMQGSAIRRIGFERWQRNVVVAAGNALRQMPTAEAAPLRQALVALKAAASALVDEHLEWALADPALH